MADEPDAFAAACARLLTDPDLRHRLVDEAEKAFLARFQWSVAAQRIRDLTRLVTHQPESAS